jgi:hypothetical protein
VPAHSFLCTLAYYVFDREEMFLGMGAEWRRGRRQDSRSGDRRYYPPSRMNSAG